MTLELDAPVRGNNLDPESLETRTATGKLVSFRYLAGALRRRRWLWMSIAVIGLLVGGAYHSVVPRTYAAYATIYMAHAPGTDDAIGMANDIALLDNTAVGRGAIALLGEPSLSPGKLLGKTPGVAVSDNVLTVTINGPSYKEAVRRVNAVTSAYLSFRDRQYNAQDNAIVSGLNKQIGFLTRQINVLTSSIGQVISGTNQLTQLVDQRSQDETEIANLQQTVQQDQLDTISVLKATRVLSAGSPIASSTLKLTLIASAMGLGAGLAIGLGIVILPALVSDKVRRREDVATILGTPVGLSLKPMSVETRPPRGRRRALKAVKIDPEQRRVVSYLRSRLERSGNRSVLAVAIDDTAVAAVSFLETARSVALEGKEVVLIDLTATHVLETMCGCEGEHVHRVPVNDTAAVTLFVPPPYLGPEDDRAPWQLSAERWQHADAVLALASVDLARGAWHLRGWNEAIVVLRTGRSTPQRISGTAQLLRAAGVRVASAILFDVDEDDESIGLLPAGSPWVNASLRDVPSMPPSWK